MGNIGEGIATPTGFGHTWPIAHSPRSLTAPLIDTAMSLVSRNIDQSSRDIARAFLEVQYRASPIGSPSHESGPHRRNVNLDVFDAGVRVVMLRARAPKMTTASPDSTTARHSRTVATTGPLRIGRASESCEMSSGSAPSGICRASRVWAWVKT